MDTPTSPRLIALPDEILLRLLGFLPNVDLHRCRLVHPMIKELVDAHPTPEVRLTIANAFLGSPIVCGHDDAPGELKRKEQDLVKWSALGEQNYGSEMQGPFELLIKDLAQVIDDPSWRLVDATDVHLSSGKLIILSHAYSHIHSPHDHPESFVPIYTSLLYIDLESDNEEIKRWLGDYSEGSHALDRLPAGVMCSPLPARTIAYHFLEDCAKLALVSLESQDDSLRIRRHIYAMTFDGLSEISQSPPVELGFPRFCRCSILSTSTTLLVHITSTCASALSHQDPVQVRPLSDMLVIRSPIDLSVPPKKLAFPAEDDSLEGLRYSAPTMVLLDDRHLAVLTLSERACCVPPSVKVAIFEITGSSCRKVSEIAIPREIFARHNPNRREVHLCACCARSSIYFIRACRLRILRVGSEDRLVCSVNVVNRFFAGDCSFDLGCVKSLVQHSERETSREWSGEIMMEWDQSQCQAWSHPSWGNKFFGECFSAKQKDFLWSFGYNVPKRRLRGIESDPKRAKWLSLVDKEDTSASWKGGDRERYQPIQQYGVGARDGQYIPYESSAGGDDEVVPVLGSSFGPKTGSPTIIGVDEKRIVIIGREWNASYLDL